MTNKRAARPPASAPVPAHRTSSAPPLVILCTWLARLDGWATYHDTEGAGETGGREWMGGRDRAQSLYLLKERAFQVITGLDSPSVQLGVLKAGGSGKVWLCPACVAAAARAGVSPRDYAISSGGCPACKREKTDEDFYSLYVLRVDYGPLGQWHFHTPVPIGRRYLPAPGSEEAPVLGPRPMANGRFERLGKALSASERQQYPEPEVIYQVWEALKHVLSVEES